MYKIWFFSTHFYNQSDKRWRKIFVRKSVDLTKSSSFVDQNLSSSFISYACVWWVKKSVDKMYFSHMSIKYTKLNDFMDLSQSTFIQNSTNSLLMKHCLNVSRKKKGQIILEICRKFSKNNIWMRAHWLLKSFQNHSCFSVGGYDV